MKKIFISSDHAGFRLKEDIKKHLKSIKLNFKDLGPVNDNSVDYPDYAHKLAKKVKVGKNNVGILVCGSGTGIILRQISIKIYVQRSVLILNQLNYPDCIMIQTSLH